MKALSNEQKGAALVAASAVSYGFLYYFGVNIIKEHYSPYTTMFWRFLVAAIFLFLLLLPKIKILYSAKKEISSLLLTSAPFHGTATSLYFISASYIGSGPAGVLLFTHPITVLLFNRLIYKEEIAKICYIAIALIIFGTFLLSDFSSATFSLVGILLGILSSIFFGLYIVSSKKTNLDPLLSTFVICCGCIITCLLFALIHGSFSTPHAFKIWLNIFCLALLCTSLPILLFLKGLKFISAEKAAIVSMFEPPLLMLTGYLFLDERVSVMQFCGALIVMISALIVVIKKPPELPS